ncbi:MAG: RNA 2',3'-cyclic phosphodiesterase [Blastocatellia bacterium]|nr:RNA 2',3'-cyclic phosphodiesterase [Blastocatellia bacterium]MCS7156871.1 RNA 2',3'-cyclic phosphodiesterase [Blastocatellia bacterium]MCX7752829.1 RNA 2',3'-cyclic phosphodiesterase [Blastocatellia bacterium]MDW8167563.1 RNA 2',3'-cyclic phosphodiesterase [Acidobacteriota bacterium]MDW8256163.1 RNA 2',3'-cyclic phosphodiesterase [Acidobacteriota bacterium]
MAAIRSFVCIDVPQEVKAAIERVQAKLRRLPVEVSWTRPAGVHLTLKFLGEVEEARLGRIGEALDEIARSAAPFELVTGRGGIFPTADRPRVLWIGVRDEQGILRALVAQVEDALAQQGFARETRPFTAHLTIGRVRSERSARELARLFLAEEFPSYRFLVTHLILMRSDLRPEGALYTPLHIAPLRG